MKSDAEVRLYMKERSKGRSQEQAAARAEMSRGTARKYERAARLPSRLCQKWDEAGCRELSRTA